jgi:hypothetical protein
MHLDSVKALLARSRTAADWTSATVEGGETVLCAVQDVGCQILVKKAGPPGEQSVAVSLLYGSSVLSRTVVGLPIEGDPMAFVRAAAETLVTGAGQAG